jgi:hypothetical protein
VRAIGESEIGVVIPFHLAVKHLLEQDLGSSSFVPGPFRPMPIPLASEDTTCGSSASRKGSYNVVKQCALERRLSLDINKQSDSYFFKAVRIS